MAAVTNDHKHVGLKHHRFIRLVFCKSEVWYGSPWAKLPVKLCDLGQVTLPL